MGVVSPELSKGQGSRPFRGLSFLEFHPREAAWTTGPCCRPPARPAAWAGRFGSFTRRSRGGSWPPRSGRGRGEGGGEVAGTGTRAHFQRFRGPHPAGRQQPVTPGTPGKQRSGLEAKGWAAGRGRGEGGWGSNLSTRSPSPFVTVATSGLLKLLQMLGLLLGCGLPLVGAKEKARLEHR